MTRPIPASIEHKSWYFVKNPSNLKTFSVLTSKSIITQKINKSFQTKEIISTNLGDQHTLPNLKF
jgi:hypothetical protein